MNTPETTWAVIAQVDATRLAREASSAWQELFGAPPPWRLQTAPSRESMLLGHEPGLSGMFDQWAVAIHSRLKERVVVVEWNVDLPQAYEADGGGLRSLSASRVQELVQQFRLVEAVARPKTREVLVMKSGTLEALLDVLAVSQLPESLRTKDVPGGLAAWSVLDGGGVGVFVDELSLVGPCYWLMWGPPPRVFSCTVVENGEDIGCFEIPGPGPKRCPVMDNILGKTAPADICQALGIGEFAASLPHDVHQMRG